MSEPARLSRYLRGDLDWIVMKALSKERQRRYESPMALALDLERFGNHEPVSAGPPTSSYRMRKFVRRHRGQVIAVSLVGIAMIVGIVGTTIGLLEANRQQGLADTRRQEAEKRLGQKDRANAILLSIFDNLNPRTNDPASRPLSERLGENLDLATTALEGEATDDPLGVAKMQVHLGVAQLGLGNNEKAVVLFTRARDTFLAHLGPDHADTLKSMANLGLAYRGSGDLDRAVPIEEDTLARRRATLGGNHRDTLVAMNNLALSYQVLGKFDRALPLLEDALAIQKTTLGLDHSETLASMNNLASLYRSLGRFDRALALFEETSMRMRAKHGPTHSDTLTSMSNLAQGYVETGNREQALPIFEQTLALMRTNLGHEHPSTLGCGNNLALCYQMMGRIDLALPLFEESLAVMKRRVGADHPDTLTSMGNLASAYWLSRQLDRSIPLYEDTLRLRIARSGTDHPETWRARANLGVNYKDAERLDEALPLLETSYEASRRKPELAWVASPLLDLYVKRHQNEKIVTLSHAVVDQARATRPAGSLPLASVLASTALHLIKAEQWDAAEPLVREALAIRQRAEPDVWSTFNTRSLLGGVLMGQRKYEDADSLLRTGYEGLKARAVAIPPQGRARLVEAVDRLIALAEARSKPEDAAFWRAEKASLEAMAKPPTKPKS